MIWTTPVIVEICIGLEINGYLHVLTSSLTICHADCIASNG